MGEQKEKKDYLLVAAIDFGTAYSGYAFSSSFSFGKDPLQVSSNTWQGGTLMSLKTPTCVLFDKKKQFTAFGFQAEDIYSDKANDNEHQSYYFFRRFKMRLFDKMTLKRRFMLQEEMGKKMPAMDVFSACIKYLKDHLMDKCEQQLPGTPDSDIRWVLTVPAIWNDASKQFMREAAENAGIIGDNLLIALEPEAASLCCRHLPITIIGGSGSGFKPFAPKSKYLVFDAGGGTIDITVHEVQPNGTLKELYKANGGSWGGVFVDEAFRNLLTDIVGNDVMDNFAATKMMDYIDLFREFEIKKRTFKNEMKEKIMFKIPIALLEQFQARKKKEMKDHINSNPKYKDKVSWIGDKLRIEADVAKGLFEAVCTNAAKHLESLFKEGPVKDVSTILMVGGFSESPMLQAMVKKALPRKKVIIPQEPGLVVLKGAVIFGHDPSVIQERRCRFTYGVKTSFSFKTGVDPEAKKIKNSDGKEFCDDKFDKHVTIGQAVTYGESQVTRSYTPVVVSQTKIRFSFHATKETEPNFVTDEGCDEIGELTVELTGTGLDRPVSVQMIFSGTELHAEAVEEKNKKKKTKAVLNFLG